MSTAAQTPSPESVPKYAQVALPVHLRKLFTYRLPPSLQNLAQVGSRVLVKLGTKPTTVYILALMPKLRDGTSLVESEIKEIESVLDVEPAIIPEVLQLTRW